MRHIIVSVVNMATNLKCKLKYKICLQLGLKAVTYEQYTTTRIR